MATAIKANWHCLVAIAAVILLGRGSGLAVETEAPWDYDPYRVLVWITPGSAESDPAALNDPLADRLDSIYKAAWLTTIQPAPDLLVAGLRRGLDDVSFQSLVAGDLVLAVSRTFEEASSVRSVELAIEKLPKIGATAAAVERLAASEDPSVRKLAEMLTTTYRDPSAVLEAFTAGELPAAVFQRGLLEKLPSEVRTVQLAAPGQIGSILSKYDKLFIVRLHTAPRPAEVSAVEVDLFMHRTGPVVTRSTISSAGLAAAAARAITAAFAPVARIEDAGTKTAKARVRAGGLIRDPQSPAAIHEGDYLRPYLRRDDRAGTLAQLQLIDWTYLRVTQLDGTKLEAEVYAGRVGGLQGRTNSRTHKWAFKVRPHHDHTILRLHAKGNVDQPLVGYEVYEKDLETEEMTLVGRTDWDGRLRIEKTEDPMRLLYVKNGGAILARLPTVPGETVMESANLIGDDTRLEAEAYLRSVENAIVDLIAIRTMLAARIRLKMEKGDIDGAEELLRSLQAQPTYKIIADDMQREATLIRSDNRSEQAKIDRMFAATRELLVENITPKLVRDLEQELLEAKKGPPPSADRVSAASN